MNITQMLLDSSSSGVVDQLAAQFGIKGDQVREALSWLVPSISRGMQRQTQEIEGVESLLDALRSGSHQHYIESPADLARGETESEGNSILGHIFGSKEVSRNVAEHASRKTGLSSSLLKKMLPVAAAMLMGTVSKKLMSNGTPPPPAQSQSLLSSLLDSDRDGSVIDDVLGMAFRSAIG